ncbi:hypothetical protein GO755_36590 [Spirosoma sp. HMF4905]|uniref:Uncharacterized protein n=1 Tax=Spirosoma arboris TaxID=2682092 RepID=A0A7K1SPI7_9BACT|nr:hypothetical protein [Spirosoma arboris]MVM35593.1 hypothetical protein [Spirosoma arboris]
MKQKPDEFPDNWVRQALSQLPDVPPPGSSFNSERLWKELSPELQQVPPRRLVGLLWWVAAACLSGLTLGWFWLYQSTNEQTVVATHASRNKADASVVSPYTPISANEIARSKVAEKERPVPSFRLQEHAKERRKGESIPKVIEPIEAVVHMPEVTTVAETPSISEQLLGLPESNVAISSPKRRFKVVHENELRAEEETRPKLYPTENFVRIGTGGRTESDESRPALTLPLTHKPNQ